LERAGILLRKLRARGSDEPIGFLWVEQGKLAASGCPASRQQVKWLAKHGINTILTLTEEPLPAEWVEGLTITSEHVPMKGAHQPIEPDNLSRAASLIQAELHNGKRVLVHCHFGRGRTMTVLAAYLVLDKKMGPGEAIRTLRAMRPGAIEEWQEKAVFDYAKTIKQDTQVHGREPKGARV
jgi:atypical dual specificity phosphatase